MPIAVAAHVWWYNPRYILGVICAGELPLEEVLFFVVIPVCGLLTYSAVDAMLSVLRRSSHEGGAPVSGLGYTLPARSRGGRGLRHWSSRSCAPGCSAVRRTGFRW